MDQPLTFLKLAETVLEQTKIPLTYVDIWDEAVKSGLSKRVNTKGKTPWNSIGAQIYVDIRDNQNSIFGSVEMLLLLLF
ncbi:winged helix-turn-helix domain-containing protein [uncultured Methanomethylovorans sp.]|uniref:winged helix-turn-helix domain-containing protein n=1 Tax=uncultured Methanomethylovorans sp. TaxID=183759 RepID=UPI002AA7C7D3|nr:winged helix-turn-helix domain-containing protein [uncultured Methanomethylovorans sp.]